MPWPAKRSSDSQREASWWGNCREETSPQDLQTACIKTSTFSAISSPWCCQISKLYFFLASRESVFICQRHSSSIPTNLPRDLLRVLGKQKKAVFVNFFVYLFVCLFYLNSVGSPNNFQCFLWSIVVVLQVFLLDADVVGKVIQSVREKFVCLISGDDTLHLLPRPSTRESIYCHVTRPLCQEPWA